ncbi:LOW QUALITY PROTEIN: hypothetical protein MXB_1370, partial [Myxobolus squamalis]
MGTVVASICTEGLLIIRTNSRGEVVTVAQKETTIDAKSGSTCVKSVRISSASTYNSREGSVITFTDKFTGLKLSSHVFVDKIRSIEIVTRRRILYISDIKEKIEVIARDHSGNVFTSLDGMVCEWLPSCHAEQKCKSRLPVSLQGNIVLLEALHKGNFVLSVHLADAIYKDVKADVILTVREYITLEPENPQYVLPGTYFTFKAFRLVRSKYEEIAISPNTYELKTSNLNVTKIHSNFKTLIALSVGHSVLSLSEKSDYTGEFEPFQVSIHVVDPTHLTLMADDQENWLLQLNKTYTVNLQFHYLDHIIVTKNLSFDTNFSISSNIADVEMDKTDGQHFILRTKSVGVAELNIFTSEFKTKFNSKSFLSSVLFATVQLEIVKSISITPSLMISPFLESDKIKHFYNFQAVGGSDRYSWDSSPTNYFLDNMESKFIAPSYPGIYQITCRDRMNQYISATAIFKSLTVLRIKLYAQYHEIPTSLPLFLNVELIGKEEISGADTLITHYSPDLLSINYSDSNIFHLCSENNLHNHSFCLVSNTPGCTTITISFVNSYKKISTTIKLCSFYPLKVVSKSQFAVPGSFITVNLTGGPLSIISKKFKQELK